VNVRNVWDNERNRMRAYPQESLFIFKVEKITGALHFLNSLRNVASAFVEIEKDINKHIETLLSYNFEIYPKVREQYEEIEKRIAKEQYELSIKESKRDSVVCSLKPYEEELEDLCKEITSWFERNEKEDIYKKSNPEYVRLLNEKQDLNAKISEHRNHINEYSNFNTMLQEAIKLIDSVREVA
jgi:chromosome segregation ATPase